MKIYHNPRCRKSRETLQLIEEKGIKPEVVEYLKVPLTKEELSDVLNLLEIEPQQLLRKNEAIFKSDFKGKELSREKWIEAMIEHPKLIERPIVIEGNKAVIGRPPEKVKELF